MAQFLVAVFGWTQFLGSSVKSCLACKLHCSFLVLCEPPHKTGKHATREAIQQQQVSRLEMAPSRAWRPAVGAMLALVSFMVGPTAVTSFALSAAKLNKVADSRRPLGINNARRLTPTATAMLPAAAAEQASSSIGEIVGGGSTAAAGAIAAAVRNMPSLVLAEGRGLLAEMDPAKLGLFAFAGLGVAAAGFSTAVYWRMQYVVSAWPCGFLRAVTPS